MGGVPLDSHENKITFFLDQPEKKNITFISQRIHAWYSCLHLPYKKSTIHVGKSAQSHGFSMGFSQGERVAMAFL